VPSHSLDFTALLDAMSRCEVLVLGDVCLDRYIMGRPTRLSREAPVAVLEWEREYSLPGEASNPALNIASLGARAHLVGWAGADAHGDELERLLQEKGVSTGGLFRGTNRATTVKTRVLASGLLTVPQQMARIDRTEAGPATPRERECVATLVESTAAQVDALLVSDYRHGFVDDALVRCVREAAQTHNKLTTVDSQGVLDRFAGFDYVRCNRHEAAAELGVELLEEGDYERELPKLAEKLGCRGLVVTRDADGMSHYSGEYGYERLRAVPVPVADGVGAGDTVIAVLTLALAAGATFPTAARAANAAAALVVQHVGNACPTPEALLDQMRSVYGAE